MASTTGASPAAKKLQVFSNEAYVTDTRRRFIIHGMPFTNKETREEVLAQVKDHRNDGVVPFTSSRKAGETQTFLRDQRGREIAALKQFQISSSSIPPLSNNMKNILVKTERTGPKGRTSFSSEFFIRHTVDNLATKSQVVVMLLGDFNTKRAQIFLGPHAKAELLIADVKRNPAGKKRDKTYVLTMESGVDSAFVTAVTLQFLLMMKLAKQYQNTQWHIGST